MSRTGKFSGIDKEKNFMEKVILVEHLEKQFGDVTAVKDICFPVKKGELFGFLGVN